MKTSALLSILFVAACSSSPRPTTTGGDGAGTGTAVEPGGDTTGGDTTGGGTTGGGDQQPDRPGRGQPCGADDACADGLECVTYYGIAGPSGPAFKSCETRCSGAGKECPEGTSCTTIADGPGEVCR